MLCLLSYGHQARRRFYQERTGRGAKLPPPVSPGPWNLSADSLRIHRCPLSVAVVGAVLRHDRLSRGDGIGATPRAQAGEYMEW